MAQGVTRTEGRTIRRALVTGASGFVGRALCEELAQRGVDVVAAARRPGGEDPYQWVRLQLPGPVPTAALDGVDTVFHLAGRAHAAGNSREDAALYDLVNRQGTREVARAAADAGVERFLLMSSVKAMRPPGKEIVPEDDDALPVDPYGLSKRMAEHEAFSAGSGKMSVVVLRPALVYGPGVKGNLATLLKSLQRGRRPPLPRVDNRRSLVALGDLVRCSLLAAEIDTAAGQTYVITDGQPYSTERIVRALADAIGVEPSPALRIPLTALGLMGRAGDALETFTGRRSPLNTATLDRLLGNAEYESRRIGKELGFRPSQTLEQMAHAIVSNCNHEGTLR
jgi:UDP-glucose 4-epimerase